MYVDQEAAQDDEEQLRTGTNRPPTAGNDVSTFEQPPVFTFPNHFEIGSPNDSCYAPSSIHRCSSVKQQSSTRVLREKYVHRYIWTTIRLNDSLQNLFSPLLRPGETQIIAAWPVWKWSISTIRIVWYNHIMLVLVISLFYEAMPMMFGH